MLEVGHRRGIVEDPVSWWRDHFATFPYLISLARIMLSIPFASVF